jgi:cobaltochelatase CobS
MELLVRDAIKLKLESRKQLEADLTLKDPVTSIESTPMPVSKLADGAYELLNISKSTFPDFYVTKFSDGDIAPELEFLVPDPDLTYKLPVEESLQILLSWETNDKTLIFGPTGSGKSSLVKELCARTGRPFLRINATGDMDSSMLFGQLTAKDGSTVWQDGSVTEAVKHGAVLAWDEWELTPPEISMGMQWLLEENARLFLKEMPGKASDKYIVPHANFRIVCMGNTQGTGDETGHHAGTNVQNTATLDRFGTVVKLDYLSPEHEQEIITNKTKVTKKIATDLIKIATLIRQAYKTGQLNITMSPRTLIGVCRKMDLGLSMSNALQLQYYNKLNDSNQRIAKELVKKVIGV